ncbi:MAG TPA: rhomboid family intramembrane serine protease [Phycisphaerae bacterium]|nr:rhomboid family intramembrane serine protease [Phycisphaerae bacterium]
MLAGLPCKCGKRLKVPESRVGKTGHCPHCRSPLRLIAPSYRSGADRFEGMLEIVAGPERVGEIILLGGPGPIEIGRSGDRHLILTGRTVSRNHCRLVRSSNGWHVEDCKSTSGLYLNGRRIEGANLQDGDRMRIGDYELSYWQPEAAPAASRSLVDASAQAPHAVASMAAPSVSPADPLDENVGPSLLGEGLDDDNLYRLSDGEVLELATPEATSPTESASQATIAQTGGSVCPSCQKSLAPNAKICVACGIDLKTGRAILTSHDADLDTIYVRAEQAVQWLSWVVWAGVYPVASEAFGVRKPYFARSIAILTVLTSFWFWSYRWSSSSSMSEVKNYMLWTGGAQPDPTMLLLRYRYTDYGDGDAFHQKLEELRAERAKKARASARAGAKPAAAGSKSGRENADEGEPDTEQDEEIEVIPSEDDADLILAAHNALPPEKQCYGRYSPWQLITHAFLHGDIFHLAGNLLFLLVIGSRINALVGNLPMLVLYPVLGAAAAAVHMISEQQSLPQAMLGASGAIMGLAGMYLVLMPVYNVHMAAWMRLGILTGFHLSFKLFAVRGFWVVLFYIAFDVIYTTLGVEDGVAHWAHLGGFLAGVGIALILLFTRLVNCRGGDAVSALLGKHAWALIGKPDPGRKAPLEFGW